MSLARVVDAGNDVMEVFQYDDGYRTCTFGKPIEDSADTFRRLPSLECRDGDVFICAPAKSGTHWVWEIASMLYNGNAETIPKSKIEHMLEASSPEAVADIPSPRILNSHLHYHRLPQDMKTRRCKVIFILRNPKDLAVSLYHHVTGITAYKYDGKWENFLPMFTKGECEYGSWTDYVLEWESVMQNHPEMPIHLVYYEDLKENNLDEIIRLGKFLGIENKDGLFEAVSNKCQFKNMQKDKAYSKDIKERFIKGEFSFYRKGDIGDWKNNFTVSQNEAFDQTITNKMVDSKFKFRFTYRNEETK